MKNPRPTVPLSRELNKDTRNKFLFDNGDDDANNKDLSNRSAMQLAFQHTFRNVTTSFHS